MLRAAQPLVAKTALLLGVAVLALSCERPFVEARAPEVEILEPDFSAVFTEAMIPLRVRATSFRNVTRVDVGTTPMAFDPGTETWETTLQLARGTNLIILTATDEANVVQQDTLFAVYLPHTYDVGAPTLDEAVGGHTLTPLADGDLLVTGGAPSSEGNAVGTIQRLQFGAARFETTGMLQHARTGHTATRLPDGRVLIIGGSRVESPTSVDDLVAEVELYNPIRGTTTVVPVVDGLPPLRTYHTAVLRQTDDGPEVDILGGRGNVRSSDDPFLGTRDDIRSFRLENDTLFARHVGLGPRITPIAGHTAVPFDNLAIGQLGRYLITGSFFGDGFFDSQNVLMDYTSPFGIDVLFRAPPQVARTRHAGALLRPSLLAFFGGRQATAAEALDTPEVYLAPAGRFYTLPPADPVLGARFGLAATNFSADRILLLGGFLPDGTATAQAAFFTYDL